MKKLLILLTINIILLSCATVGNPVGGEKDKINPVLVQSKPEDQSINFKGKEVTLFFSEWMKKDNIDKELIITPRTNIDYEYTLRKQEFTLKFKENLKDSTTYTLNFREGLMDITENNLWLNPRISFSTGNFLDSMKIVGNVIDLMTNKALKGYTIGLYDPKIDTSNLRQGEPIYFTTTDEQGNYLIQNIKAGKYLLYGFKDSNNNLINDPSNESFAYIIDSLDIRTKSKEVNLKSIKVNQDTLKLVGSSANGKDFIIKFNKGLQKISLTNIADTSQYLYRTVQEDGKSIQLYRENLISSTEEVKDTDSTAIEVAVIDSIGYQLKDTVYAKFRKSNVTNENIKLMAQGDGHLIGDSHTIQLALSKPFHTINYDSILIKYGAINLNKIDKSKVDKNHNKNLITLNFNITQKELDSLKIKVQKDKLLQNKDSINNTNNDSTSTISKETSIVTKKESKDKRSIGSKQASGNIVNSTNTSQSNNNADNSKGLHLYIGTGAFIGLEQDSTKSTEMDLYFKEISNFGSIRGEIIGQPKHFVIQLLKENFTLVDTIRNTNKYEFTWLKPDKYIIRVIVDNNNNGKWDAGNPMLGTPSESVIHFDEILTLKANWEIIDKVITIESQNEVKPIEVSKDVDN